MFRTNTLNHTNSKSPGVGYFLTLIIASLLAVLVSAGLAHGQDIQKLNRLVQTSNASGPADDMLRAARELIDGKKWAKAAEVFGNFITEYPNHKNVDAALYWRAYAFMQQRKNEEARENAERLINEHPKSTWKKDADALLIQISSEPRVNPNDPEELKIIALQSLFQRDPAQAIQYAADWLKPGSKRSQEAKEAAISLLGQYGGAQGAAMLAEIVRNEPNAELREAAVHWVAQRGTLADLIKLYDSERSQDVRESILHRIAERWKDPAAANKLMDVAKNDANTELREAAIHRIAERSGTQATTFLTQLYDAERNQEVKESVLHRLAERSQDPAAMAKLMEVAKNDPNTELREAAIHRIAERSGVEMLIQLFDAERNRDVKESILHRLAERARSQRTNEQSRDAAMKKLMDVARNDPDKDLREAAIHRLAEMRGPGSLNLIIQLYETEKNTDVRESILHRIAERQEPEALAKLIEIARNDANEELRSSAIHRIAERRGGQGVDALIQFYDAEKSEEVKESVLHRLGEAARNPVAGDSPQKRALRKLMQVAKSDSSVEMRKRAIHWLGESKDPEAAKFIEEIVR